MYKINIKLNNNELYIFNNLNIIQICNNNDIDIPKFCYHEKLSIAGNCRMCLVEIKGNLKPIASCSMPVSKNMEIFTNTKLVKKSREGIIEFILLNHPLDCPICDQGGECDLQDQSLIFGSDKGRFYEYKRSVNDKNCSSLIKTIMTRCIHCTRCIRFSNEIAGINNLGIVNRGKNMEISNFLNKIINSEISGNVIDLCPVGALTSKPYSFVARPWELLSFKTIDLNDNIHSNIRVDIRDSFILRILPLFKNNLNENLIADITRFSYDGYKNQRIIYPFYKFNNKFIKKSWLEILYLLKLNVLKKKINYILGNFLDAETIILLKKYSNKYGNFTFNIKNCNCDKLVDFRNNYLFNFNDFNNLMLFNNLILFGLNLRIESPILNYKIKYLVNKNLLKVFNIESFYNNNYFNYSFDNKEFLKIIEGKSFLNNLFLKKKSKNLIILNNNYNFSCINLKNYLNKYNNFSVSILNKMSVNILSSEFNLLFSINNFNDISFFSKYKNDEILFFLNDDNINIKIKKMQNFLIYQGHNLNNYNFLKIFNIILPSVNFLEKNSTNVNFFGLIQNTNFIIYPPKHSRVDWKIIYFFFKLFLKNMHNFISLKILKNDFYNYNFLINLNFCNIIIKNLILNNKIKIFNNLLNVIDTNILKLNQILKSSKIIKNYNKKLIKINTNFKKCLVI